MFATIKQKWNAFKTNWNEYMRLRADVVRAEDNVEKIREKIAVKKGGGIGCIVYRYVPVPTVSGVDHLCFAKYQFVIKEHYCPHFSGDKYLDEVKPCSQINCPFFAKNAEYVDAVRKLEAVSDKVDDFLCARSKTKSK